MQQLQLEGVVAAAAKCDVTQKQEVEQLVAWTVETYGSLDIMVANAGIVKGADFLDFSEEDWDDVLNVNLKGPFIVSLPPPSPVGVGFELCKIDKGVGEDAELLDFSEEDRVLS